jgi:hypothetical protein
MSDRFPNLGPMPTVQGHGPSLATGAASAQAGMVRIHRGSEVRYVWPVHVPGWLSSGWHLGDDRQGGAVDALVVTANPAGASLQAPASSPSPVPATATQPGPAPEREVEPIEAHLPTNLLDLEAEPAAAQGAAAENDAVSASIGGPEPIAAPAPADVAAAVVEAAQPNPANNPGAEPIGDGSEAPAADPVADLLAESSPEPTPPPAPARRGRPRKVRPEPEQQPAAEVTADDHPPAAQDSEGQQAPAAVLTTEGDDPFGLDPLL